MLHAFLIELDDGKILSGKTDQFDGKKPWVSGEDFPQQTNPLKSPAYWWLIPTIIPYYTILYKIIPY